MEAAHRFVIDKQNIGTCPCGEVRQFPWEKRGQVIVLKEGDPKHHEAEHWETEENMELKNRRRTGMNYGGRKPERHRYYEANKEAIIADLLSIGVVATCNKWNIPKGSYNRLIGRWLTEEQKLKIPVTRDTPPGRPEETPHPLTNSAPSNGRLPPLPPFSDKWQPEVQLQWLEVYGELAKRETTSVTQ